MSGKLFIVSAPSGAGKTTIVNAVLEKLTPLYAITRLITYTSKQPRHNEYDGRDYHFISRKDFEKRIGEGFFLEWSTAYEHYYGTPRSVLNDLRGGRSFFLIIDRNGAQNILRQVHAAVAIWIYIRDMQTLRERLMMRNTERQEEVEYRMTQALIEISAEENERIYHYHVMNSNLETAVNAVNQIIHREFSEQKHYKKRQFLTK